MAKINDIMSKLSNQDGDLASPIGYIKYKKINIEEPSYPKKTFTSEEISGTMKVKINIPPNNGKDVLAKITKDEYCDDASLLCSLLNFPNVPMKIIEKRLPFFRNEKSPTSVKECIFLSSTADERDNIIELIKKWCVKYGYPFKFDYEIDDAIEPNK